MDYHIGCRAVMPIDEPTLMAVLGLASITASAMFLALHRNARDIAGVRTWAFGARGE